MQLSPNFTLAEAVSPRDAVKPDDKALKSIKRYATFLERLRAKAGGKPMRLTSWYRSPAYNKRIGGESGSRHTVGDAGDIETADQIKLAVLASQDPEVGAIGLYPGRGFIHVDLRPRVGGKITTWEQVNGAYIPLRPETRKALLAAGARDI